MYNNSSNLSGASQQRPLQNVNSYNIARNASAEDQENAQLMEGFAQIQRIGTGNDSIEMREGQQGSNPSGFPTIKQEPGTISAENNQQIPIAQRAVQTLYLFPLQPTTQQRVAQSTDQFLLSHGSYPSISGMPYSTFPAIHGATQQQQAQIIQTTNNKRNANASGFNNSDPKRQRTDGNAQYVENQGQNKDQDRKDYAEYMMLIRKDIQEENYKDAESLFYKALECLDLTNAQRADLSRQLVLLQNKQKKYAESEATCLKALNLSGLSNVLKAGLNRLLAISQNRQKKYAEAETTILKTLDLSDLPNFLKAQLSHQLAFLQNEQKKYAESEATCSKALDLSDLPNEYKAKLSIQLAFSQNGQKKYAESEATCSKALDLSGLPNELKARLSIRLAFSQNGQKKYPESEATCSKALDLSDLLNEFKAELSIQLAISQNGQNKYAESEATCSKALDLSGLPNELKARLSSRLAFSQNGQKKYPESEVTCSKALDLSDLLNEVKAELSIQLAISQSGQKKHAESEATCSKALDLSDLSNTAKANLNCFLAHSQYNQGQYQSIEQKFKLALELSDADYLHALAFHDLSNVNKKNGNTSKASVYNIIALNYLRLCSHVYYDQYRQEALCDYQAYGRNHEEIVQKVSALFIAKDTQLTEDEIWQAIMAVGEIRKSNFIPNSGL